MHRDTRGFNRKHYLYDKASLDVYIDFILGTEKKI